MPADVHTRQLRYFLAVAESGSFRHAARQLYVTQPALSRSIKQLEASLDALCSRYGIDRSHRTLHGALLDAQLLAQVYVELTGGRQIGLGLVSETIEVQTSFAPAAAPAVVRPARIFTASDEELARHAAFMKKIVNPLWATESPG